MRSVARKVLVKAGVIVSCIFDSVVVCSPTMTVVMIYAVMIPFWSSRSGGFQWTYTLLASIPNTKTSRGAFGTIHSD